MDANEKANLEAEKKIAEIRKAASFDADEFIDVIKEETGDTYFFKHLIRFHVTMNEMIFSMKFGDAFDFVIKQIEFNKKISGGY